MVKVDKSRTTEAATSIELWKENRFKVEQRTNRDLSDYDMASYLHHFQVNNVHHIFYMSLVRPLSSVLTILAVMYSLHLYALDLVFIVFLYVTLRIHHYRPQFAKVMFFTCLSVILFTGGLVSQHALQVSRPTSRG